MRKHLHRTLCFTVVLLLLASSFGAALAVALPFGMTGATIDKSLVRNVKFKKTSATVKLPSSRNISYDAGRYVVISPANADNKALAWTSADESIAKVDEHGMLTVFNEGKVKITAAATDGSLKKASFQLTVNATRVKSLSIVGGTFTFDIGDTHIISPVIKPSNATYGEPRFSSSDESVASVSTDGIVTAKSGGVATITIAADNPNKEKSVKTKKMTVRVRSSKPATFSLSAVGDVILGGDRDRGTWASFKKYLEVSQQEFGDPYVRMLSKASKYFNQSDVTVANLECAVTTKSYGSAAKGKYVFRALPQYLNVLKHGGIDVVNLANNHTNDFGSAGYQNTKKNLESYGIAYNGFSYKESYIRDVNGIKVGFIGFQTGKYITQYNVQSSIKKLKKECDVVVASLHFGDVAEYTFKVTGRMKMWSHFAVNAGADLVLGHHPHVLSGMENYKGSTIAYGLGSFLSVGPNPSRARRTFIFQQTTAVHPGFTEASEVKVVPFWISSVKNTNDMMPSYAPGDEAATIVKMINKYSIGTKVDFKVVEP